MNRFPGDLPPDSGDLFSHMGMKIAGFDIIKPFQDVLVPVKGVDGKEEAQGFHFVFQHKVFWVRRGEMCRGI